MQNLDDQHFMMIEPPAPAHDPVNDEMTAMAQRVWQMARKGTAWLGFHTCACGKHSDSYTWIMPDGRVTNSLLVHYVQCHRPDVPRSELAKLVIYDKTQDKTAPAVAGGPPGRLDEDGGNPGSADAN